MMKTRTGEEPVEHAFTGGLLGLVAFVVLDVCWFVMNHGVGPMSIASRLLGPPIFAFGGALLFSLAAPVLKRLRLDPAPVRIRKPLRGHDGDWEPSGQKIPRVYLDNVMILPFSPSRQMFIAGTDPSFRHRP